jgi:hypothetical protein
MQTIGHQYLPWFSFIIYIADAVLTFSQVLDPLSINRLSILVYISHQETLEVFLNRSPDGLDSHPFRDGSGLDISQFFQRYFLIRKRSESIGSQQIEPVDDGNRDQVNAHIVTFHIIVLGSLIILSPPPPR